MQNKAKVNNLIASIANEPISNKLDNIFNPRSRHQAGDGPSQYNSHFVQQNIASDMSEKVGAEALLEKQELEKIFRISDILGSVSLREQDIKEVVNFMIEVYPNLKNQFMCLN